MTRRNTILLALGLIVLTLVYYGMSDPLRTPRRLSSSVYSDSSLGIHLFYQWAEKIRPGSVVIDRKALSSAELTPETILLLLSPRKGIKEREAKLIADFVSQGGALILSFETEETWNNLRPLLSALGLPDAVKEDGDFKNRTLRILTLNQDDRDTPFFESGKRYAFYSRYGIEAPECRDGNFSCFAVERTHGEGRVLLTAGLPLLSNVLISKADNRNLAFRLLESGRPLLIDEYHHFYSDHTFAGLMKQPSFGIPFLSLIGCLLLLFLFGYSPLQEVSRKEKETQNPPSYHELNENILHGVLDRAGADSDPNPNSMTLRLHQSFLEKIFPYEKTEILKAVSGGGVLSEAENLIKLHQRLLLKRRGL